MVGEEQLQQEVMPAPLPALFFVVLAFGVMCAALALSFDGVGSGDQAMGDAMTALLLVALLILFWLLTCVLLLKARSVWLSAAGPITALAGGAATVVTVVTVTLQEPGLEWMAAVIVLLPAALLTLFVLDWRRWATSPARYAAMAGLGLAVLAGIVAPFISA